MYVEKPTNAKSGRSEATRKTSGQEPLECLVSWRRGRGLIVCFSGSQAEKLLELDVAAARLAKKSVNRMMIAVCNVSLL